MNKILSLKEYSPKSMHKVNKTYLEKSKYPVIDSHNHLGQRFGHPWQIDLFQNYCPKWISSM